MKKGIRGHDFNIIGLDGIVEKCNKEKIEYLQLVLDKSIDGFKFGDFSEEYAHSIKKEMKNIKLAILGSYINLSNPNENELNADIESFKEKIKYASILSPIAVGSETGIYKEGLTHSEEAYQYLLKNVREIVKYAEKLQVTIAIEAVHLFVIDSPQKLKRLVKDINSEYLKVIFDPVNLINTDNYHNQDELIKDMFNLLGDKITAIHIKDFVVNNGIIESMIPGEGMLNFKLIFDLMRKMNIDVPLICEGLTDAEAIKAFENLSKF